MNTFKESAIKVLQEAKKPLHYKEITRIALEKGLLETDGKTPESTMNSQIVTDIKVHKEKSDFIKTGEATYTLNSKKPKTPKAELDTEQEKIVEEKVQIESGYTGKGGEMLVCSELLFRGFNASIMSVDLGLDIVATKNERMYGIQVKTSNLNSFDTYVFDVRKTSFERHNTNNIYYIFVLHGENENNFLIIPYQEMDKLVKQKIILEVGHGSRYRINIKFRNDKIYLGNLNNDTSYYLNNWEIIS